jgi:hypothetical protein
VEGGHPQDFAAMFSDALTGAHAFIVLSDQRRGQRTLQQVQEYEEGATVLAARSAT